jgi:hypothetical protein
MKATVAGWLYDLLSEQVTVDRFDIISNWIARVAFLALASIGLWHGPRVLQALVVMLWFFRVADVVEGIQAYRKRRRLRLLGKRESLDAEIKRYDYWLRQCMSGTRKMRDDKVEGVDIPATVRDLRRMNWGLIQMRRERGDYEQEEEQWPFVQRITRRIGRN